MRTKIHNQGGKLISKYTKYWRIIDKKCTSAPYKFAIPIVDIKSSTRKIGYQFICKKVSKGYIIPVEFFRKYLKDFTGDGRAFAVTIDPDRDLIKYKNNEDDIRKYAESDMSVNKTALSTKTGKTTGSNDKQVLFYPSSYDKEQEEIVNEIKQKTDTIKNRRYKGNITVQIIVKHLMQNIPADHLKIVAQNFFIEGDKLEYDALLIKNEVDIVQQIFNPDDVIATLEVKESGFRPREKVIELAKAMDKTKMISILICGRIQSPSEASFIRKKIKNAFILSDRRWRIIDYRGEWEKLVNFVKSL